MPDVNRPALFVFAHQDDEVAYGCMLRNMANAGRDIRVIWITDGARFVPAEVRRGESTANMKRAGISKERLTFWDYPDGGAIRFASEIVERLTMAMREIGPGEVYAVACEGGHPDHDFAHFAAVKAASAQEKKPPVFEAPCYNKSSCGYAHSTDSSPLRRRLFTHRYPEMIYSSNHALS